MARASLEAVLHLSHPKGLVNFERPTSLPPAPPLQRPTKAHLKPPDMSSAEDCLAAHVEQIEARQAELARDRKLDKRWHEEQMNELKQRVAHSFEEMASRRSWHRQVAADQLAQTDEKLEQALADYKEAHSGLEYWPYEADKPGMIVPDKKVYGAELLLACQQKANAKELQKLANRRGLQATSLKLRMERRRELAQQEAASGGRVPPHEAKAALAEADRKRREVVARQAEGRVKPEEVSVRGHKRESFPVGEKFFRDVSFSKFDMQEAQRKIRDASNKEQLRAALAKQMADKRQREKREHEHTYGEGPTFSSLLDRELAARAATSKEVPGSAEARRAELEKQIAQKQRERKLMRRTAMEEQQRLDEATVAHEALVAERARMRQAEVRTQMQIEIAKEESRVRRERDKQQAMKHA